MKIRAFMVYYTLISVQQLQIKNLTVDRPSFSSTSLIRIKKYIISRIVKRMSDYGHSDTSQGM